MSKFPSTDRPLLGLVCWVWFVAGLVCGVRLKGSDMKFVMVHPALCRDMRTENLLALNTD